MFSIAMATYNGELYLREQLQSLAEQTLLPSELVISDDASTDATGEVVRLFAATAPFPVRFSRNEQRLGYHENFMKAAGLCASDYIAFCDQDDVWLSHKLAVAQKTIGETNCALFQHGFRLIDATGNPISGDADHWGLEGAGRWGMTRGMTQVFKRSLLSYGALRQVSVDHTVGKGVMSHDQWILFIASLMGTVVTVKDVLVHYRQHGQNVFGYNADRIMPANFTGTVRINASRWMGNPEEYEQKRGYLVTMLSRMAAGARSRAGIVESLKRDAPEDRLAVLEENLRYYTSFEKYIRQRLSIYAADGKLRRLSRVLSMYFGRSYQAFGSRGIKDSGLDVLYGVMH